MSEPERKAEVVSLREARRRREAQAKAQVKAQAKAKPRTVSGSGREPMIRSWPRLLAVVGILLTLAVLGALLRML